MQNPNEKWIRAKTDVAQEHDTAEAFNIVIEGLPNTARKPSCSEEATRSMTPTGAATLAAI